MDQDRLTKVSAIRKYIKGQVQCPNFLRQCTVKRIGSGTYNDAFKISLPKDINGYEIVMRLSYYDKGVLLSALQTLEGCIFKEGKKLNVSDEAMQRAIHLNRFDPVKVKNNYSLVCRYFVDTNVCPNFVYMYHYADAHSMFTQLRHLLPEKRLLQPQQDFSNASFHELFDCNLYHALIHKMILTDQELCSIIFQVMYAMHTLQFYLPGFRHNDLSTSNILLKYPGKGSTACPHMYSIGDNVYKIPPNHAFAAVWDFDLSHSPGRCTRLGNYTVKHNWEGVNLRNIIITKDKFANYKGDVSVRNINGRFNTSFDSHFFLSSLRKALQKTDRKFIKTEQFINDNLPKTGTDYTDKVHANLVPGSLLKHAYFDGLKSYNAIHDGHCADRPMYKFRSIKLEFTCETSEENYDKHVQSSVNQPDVFEPYDGTIYNYDQLHT